MSPSHGTLQKGYREVIEGRGKNVIAVAVHNSIGNEYGLFPYLRLKVTTYDFMPKFPNTEEPIDKKIVSEDIWVFPHIENFSLENK